jgi:hypothetical protein
MLTPRATLLCAAAASVSLMALHPACPFHAITGLLCPGCGMTRAGITLLQGDWRAAIQYNPLIILLAGIAILEIPSVLVRNRWLVIQSAPLAPVCGAIGLVAFAILRNSY